MKIIIIGSGPCGLGAAWRLNELGHDNWTLFEQNNHVGGLSASFQDKENFWWDIGGHVLFSHYPYFDQVMDKVMDSSSDWLYHDRSAWVWMQNRFIPYPIQNNIHRLPKDLFKECLYGLMDLNNSSPNKTLRHFGDWIDAGFGRGLAKWFLNPYNFKVWAYPVNELSHNWVGERVAKVDVKRIIDNHLDQKDDIAWGPNARFRFPKYRGTGAIWENLSGALPKENIHLNSRLKTINPTDKTLEFTDGRKENYDTLISTIPLDDLAELTGMSSSVSSVANGVTQSTPRELKYSATHIVGLALKGTPPDHLKNKCWIYFPEKDNPFYRVTVFSNYSPNNVPDSSHSWSLMCEVSESAQKPVDSDKIVDQVVQGTVNTRLIKEKSQINHTWYKRVEKGYPTPSVNRNRILFPWLNHFKEKGILSRGRFGAWRYEVGNMDHSFMQGVESADQVLYRGEELTLWYPDIVNVPHPSAG